MIVRDTFVGAAVYTYLFYNVNGDATVSNEQ